VTLLDKAVQAETGSFAALNNLGVALLAVGDRPRAVSTFRKAVALNAGGSEVHGNLGLALLALGDLEAAEVSLVLAIDLAGHGALPLFRRGLAELRIAQGRLDDAERWVRALIDARPCDLDALLVLGRILVLKYDWPGAEACFDRILEISPGHLSALCALAEVVGDDRVEFLRRALQGVEPQATDTDAQYLAHRALAILAQLLRDVEGECHHLQRALEYRPDAVEVQLARAKLRLLRGDFESGWSDFEWRWRQPRTVLRPRRFRRRHWRGEALLESPILLHAEGGLGCVIQFARYAPLVAARGGRVVIEAPQPLVRLLKSLDGVDQVIAFGAPLPPVGWQCPLESLPLAFKTTLSTVPAEVPYLAADPAEARAWSERLPDAFRVAVVWATSSNPLPDNRRRAMPAGVLAPLGNIPGISVISLQHHSHKSCGTLPFVHVDAGAELKDCAVTAAVIASVDLVVTVDTAAAHLAGALGKPVWILLPYAGAYRWLLDREDSPWYPTARLFRQPAPGDWGSVVARVAEDIRQRVA
jgi:tetratricopeptide (TPR) repeat protein